LKNASSDGELILPKRATIHTLLREARAPLYAYALPVSVNSHVVPKRTRLADGDLVISAKAGQGLQALRQRLLQTVGWQAAPEGVYMARERHLTALAAVGDHLSLAREWLGHAGNHLDLLAEELRLAQDALGSITGEFTADDLLGTIFTRFCIGK
jgi:tRNA U34 5-carboxymethylaminomethyl modifying GTPase MnmE/TrmE